MKPITFITGNEKKAEYLSRYLRLPVKHLKIHLDEIQSLDLFEIVEHKVKQAYKEVHGPVLVEDVSLKFSALGKLPWPFIKFFESELGLEKLAKLASEENRNAVAICVFWYYDGEVLKFFEGSVPGRIAESPRWNWGFGWDKIFIPYFSSKTAAEMNEKEYERFYTEEKPFEKIYAFLHAHEE